MKKLSKSLIDLGTSHEHLRPHLKVVLAHLEKQADAVREFNMLLDQAEDLALDGDTKGAKKLLDKALKIAESSRNGTLMSRYHKAVAMVESGKQSSSDLPTVDNFLDFDFEDDGKPSEPPFIWSPEAFITIGKRIESQLRGYQITSKSKSQIGFRPNNARPKQGPELFLELHRAHKNLYVAYLDYSKPHQVSDSGIHYAHLPVHIPNSDNLDVSVEEGFKTLERDILKACKILFSGKGFPYTP